MGRIAGIDLGTTHSAIGVVDSGFPILLADGEGRRITPSVVAFTDEGVVVGRAAQGLAAVQPAGVVSSVKRLMGTAREVAGHSPEEVSAEILRHLKVLAEEALDGEAVERAVVTVPAYFNHAQREATKRAAELAGLSVERILAEPTAAALSYGLDKLEERSRIAVYDWGGGTFDVSVLELRDGIFEVLATSGDTLLGGDDVDAALGEFLARTLSLGKLSSADEARVRAEARRVKEALSEQGQTVARLPFLTEQELVVGREDLAALAGPLVERTRRHCLQALKDAQTEAGQLQAVLLVGGSTRMPLVRERVAEWFEREPDLSQHPDEAVALGATIHAGVLSGTLRKMTLLDVTPLSLGVETVGGLMNVLIPRNTTIPCKAGELFTNAVDGQESMRVRILQGERELAADNWELGTVDVRFGSAARGQARVGVQFEIDADGLLTVLARDTQTGQDTLLEIDSAAVDVGDEQVERMVEESVEHAFEDFEARILTEARLKAEELLPAVEQSLAVVGEELPEEEGREIFEAQSRVEEALRAGRANDLKAAVQDLDRATEALAARVVEKAMEEALARRGV
ncbi:MAG: Hsp70 family protein [Verrucomicrobiota bacterium]